MAKRKKVKRLKGPCGGRVKAQAGGQAHKVRRAARKAVGDVIGVPVQVDDPRHLGLHESFFGRLTEKLMEFGIPPTIAGAVAEGLGNVNELVSGGVEGLSGQPVFSPKGIDLADLEANVKGIKRAQTDRSRSAPKKVGAQTGVRGKKGGKVPRRRGQLGGVGTPVISPRQPAPPPVAGTVLPGLIPQNQPQQIVGGPFPTGGQLSSTQTTGTEKGTVQNIADTKALDNIVQQIQQAQAGGGQDISALRGFDPFTGQLGATQQDLLSTGLKTDVSGATEAAKIRAGQEFDAASDKINELLASKGLLSSTARDAAIARERAKLGERIGATGLEADIAAQEAAAGRQVQGVGAGLQGSGQQLAATQGAGQLDLSRTGQNLQGQLGAGQLAGQSAELNKRIETTGERTGTTTGGQTNFGFNPPGGAPVPNRFAGLMGQPKALAAQHIPQSPQPTTVANPQPPVLHSAGAMGSGSRGLMGAQGGQVPNLKEFEAWLEKLGRKTLEAFGPEAAPISDPEEKRRVAMDIAMRNFGGAEEAFRLFNDPELQEAALAEGRRRRAALRDVPQTTSSGDPHTTDLISGFNSLRTLGKGVRFNLDPEASEFVQVRDKDTGQLLDPLTSEGIAPDPFSAAGREAKLRGEFVGQGKNVLNQEGIGTIPGQQRSGALEAGRPGGIDILGLPGSVTNREFFQSGGPVNPPNTVPFNRPTANLADLGMAQPTLVDSRRQFFEGGGEVPGQDTGQDQVPALLRSEELVVTPELVEAIQAAQTPDAAMAVVEALKVLAQKPLEFDEEQGEHVAQSGGQLGSIGGAGRQFGIEPTEPTLGQKVQEFLESLLGPAGQGAPKQDFGQLDQGPAPVSEGPPQPTSIQKAMDTFELQSLREKPEFMPIRRPGFPESAEIVPGVGGAAPTLRARGPNADLVEDPQAGKGTVSSFGAPAMTEEQLQMARLERAKSRRDLIQHALIMDPVGGPEKFARLNNSLENANKEVENLVNEVVARERNRVFERQARAAELSAEAALSNTVSNRLQAEAAKATAYATVAEKLQKAAAMNPQVAQVIEAFAKMNPNTERGQAIAEANLKMIVEQLTGITWEENGWWEQLLTGAPQFELIQLAGQEQLASGVSNPNISPEIASYMELYGG